MIILIMEGKTKFWIFTLGYTQTLQGTVKLKVEAQNITSSDAGGKDENLVFVAGATGKVGSRTVRCLFDLITR